LISTPAFCKKLTQQQQQRTCLELEMDFSEWNFKLQVNISFGSFFCSWN
jgi:hypothetical protein